MEMRFWKFASLALAAGLFVSAQQAEDNEDEVAMSNGPSRCSVYEDGVAGGTACGGYDYEDNYNYDPYTAGDYDENSERYERREYRRSNYSRKSKCGDQSKRRGAAKKAME